MIEDTRAQPHDPFFQFYDREDPAYGLSPSAELDAFLKQCPRSGRALDLGAGAGRDTLALARAGFQVTSVDASLRGLEQIGQRAQLAGIADNIETLHCDVRQLVIEPEAYTAIVATTVLDHLPPQDAAGLWNRMILGLAPEGVLYVEVHTVEDPGCPANPHPEPDAPVSETAAWVVNYFPLGALLRMAASQTRLRVLRYEERYEWDYTHGLEHKHAKAILLACRSGCYVPWYGHPSAFPRHSDQ